MAEQKDVQNMQRESYERFMQQRKAIADNLAGARRIIAVYSAKGGVGKTTVAVQLALALARQGKNVGVFDADIDCPNASAMLGTDARCSTNGKRIRPAEAQGVKIVSMDAVQGSQDKARVWRGPMLTNAITELLSLVEWGELDFLLVDLPPGTSDAPLTIMQLVPLDGILLVTTPQRVACLDCLRSGNMAIEMGQKITGVVENMSGGAFGKGGADAVAEKLGAKVLARIPLEKSISNTETADAVDDAVKQEFDALAKSLGATKPGLRVVA